MHFKKWSGFFWPTLYTWRLSVCLSVSLLATLRKKTTEWIFIKNFITDVPVDKEN